jgi:hypothetical protein
MLLLQQLNTKAASTAPPAPAGRPCAQLCMKVQAGATLEGWIRSPRPLRNKHLCALTTHDLHSHRFTCLGWWTGWLMSKTEDNSKG